MKKLSGRNTRVSVGDRRKAIERFVSSVVAIIAGWSFVSSASAQPRTYVQMLSPSASRVKLQGKSDMGEIYGSLDQFAGRLQLDTASFERSKVELRTNLKLAQWNSPQIMPAMLLTTFLAQLQDATLTFKSDLIRRVRPNVYDVQGTYVVQGKSRTLVLPVEIKRAQSNRSEFAIRMNGTVEPGREIRGAQAGGLPPIHGGVEGLFVFESRS